MDVVKLLEQAQVVGLSISLSPAGEVKIKGSKTPAALALIEELRNHKAAIIEALTPTTPTADTDVVFFNTFAEASSYWDSIKDWIPSCQCTGNCAACPGLWFATTRGRYAVRDNMSQVSTESDIPNSLAEELAGLGL